MDNTVMNSGGKFGGYWTMEVYNNKEEMKLISKSECHNIITDEGLNSILNVYLHGSTQITTWYCAIFEDNHTPAAADTYATPGYTESSAYSEGNRPEYNEAAASSKSITNSANKATFTANATKTFYGAALVGGGTGAATKGNTDGGGTLFCAGKFSTAQPVVSGNVVNLTYTVSAADDGV